MLPLMKLVVKKLTERIVLMTMTADHWEKDPFAQLLHEWIFIREDMVCIGREEKNEYNIIN